MGLTGTQKAIVYALSGVARSGATRSGYTSPSVFVSVGGVQRATARPTASQSVDRLVISDVLNDEPNKAQYTAEGWTPTIGQDVVVTLGSINNLTREFAGQNLNVRRSYIGSPARPAFQVNAIDYTWGLNKRKVTKRYTSTTVAAIAADLIATYALGYTVSVDATFGAIAIDAISFTQQEVTDALAQLVNRAGGYFRVDYFKVVRLFQTDASQSSPVALTAAHASLGADGQPVVVTTDLSQVVTRINIEGQGSVTSTPIAVGDTSIAVEDLSPFSASGGRVAANNQIISYTGYSSGSTTVTGGVTTVAGRPAPTAPVLSESTLAAAPTHDPAPFAADVTHLYSDGAESIATRTNTVTINSTKQFHLALNVGDSRVVARRFYVIENGIVITAGSSSLDDVLDNTSNSVDLNLHTYGRGGAPTFAATYAIGATYLYVDDTAQFVATGGTARVGGQVFTYTGLSTASGLGALTGVVGITSPISVGATIAAVIPVGSPALPIANTSAFNSSGGQARVGTRPFSYTGRSTTSGPGSLTGIPVSGAGALPTTATGGDLVFVGGGGAGTLTGIPASGTGAVVYALESGDDINLYVQVDDVVAQAALAALIGGDGIQEDYLQDRRIAQTEAAARGAAVLALRGSPIVTIEYSVTDPNARSGATQTVSLAAPTSVAGTFTIQDVTIEGFHPALPPTRTVKASSVRFSLNDLLRRLKDPVT